MILWHIILVIGVDAPASRYVIPSISLPSLSCHLAWAPSPLRHLSRTPPLLHVASLTCCLFHALPLSCAASFTRGLSHVWPLSHTASFTCCLFHALPLSCTTSLALPLVRMGLAIPIVLSHPHIFAFAPPFMCTPSLSPSHHPI